MVDGGIGPATIDEVAEARPDVLVVGSAFFDADDKSAVIRSLRARVYGEANRLLIFFSGPAILLGQKVVEMGNE